MKMTFRGINKNVLDYTFHFANLKITTSSNLCQGRIQLIVVVQRIYLLQRRVFIAQDTLLIHCGLVLPNDNRDLGNGSLPNVKLTRQIWGIWKLRPAYSPETPNLGQNRWCFVPCDLEIWWMTLENNRAPLLCCFKLCATFHSYRWIKTGVAVRKRPIWVKFDDF